MKKFVRADRRSELAILEPAFSGHRLAWVGLLLKSEHVAATLYTTPAARSSREASLHLPSHGSIVELPWESASQWWNSAFSRSAHAERRVLLSGDDALLYVLRHYPDARLRTSSWPDTRAVFLRWQPQPSLKSIASNGAKKLLVLALKKAGALSKFYVLDPLGESRYTRSPLIPDPVIWTNPASAFVQEQRNKILSASQGLTLIVVAGPLTERKMIARLTAALKRLGSNYVLLLAGPPDDEIESLLNSPDSQALIESGQLVPWTDHHADLTLDALIAAADCLSLLYTNVGSSGLLLKAIMAGTPVLTSANPAVANVVSSTRVGVVAHEYGPSELAAAIRRAVTLPVPDPSIQARLASGPETVVRTLLDP